MYVFLKTYESRVTFYLDRGYQYVKQFLEEQFPSAEILIPPNVTRADDELESVMSTTSQKKSKKRVLNQQEADHQDLLKFESFNYHRFSFCKFLFHHFNSEIQRRSDGPLKRLINA